MAFTIGDFLYAKVIPHTYDQLKASLDASTIKDGLIAEFGVWSGSSITHLAGHVPQRVIWGFDSFKGLPEKWERGLDTYKPGHFDQQGKMPAVPSNVKLVPGWFNETLPAWVKAHEGQKLSLLDIDCDIYSSAKCVLELCTPLIDVGTVLYFDEICDWGGGGSRYPNWAEHEYKALLEWLTKTGHEVKALSHSDSYSGSVIVVQ